MVISIDLGATNIRIAEVYGYNVKNKQKVSTPKTKKEILSLLINLIYEYKDKKIICIGIAGFVKDNKIYATPNMDFNNMNIKKLL